MKLYASELMELARKEPEKYDGKRYKVLGLYCIGPESQFYGEVIVDSEGKLQGKGHDNWAYINSNTKLEEIPPEPKPVPFMEAVKAYSEGKTVDCKVGNCRYVYQKCEGDTPYKAMHEKNDESSGVSAKEILEGTWHICE